LATLGSELANVDDVGAPLYIPVQAFQRIGRVQPDAVLRGQGHGGKHVLLGGIHSGAELGPAAAELVGNMAPGLSSGCMAGLEEDLADRGSNDCVLALGHVRLRCA
jgi:hypothetical protein